MSGFIMKTLTTLPMSLFFSLILLISCTYAKVHEKTEVLYGLKVIDNQLHVQLLSMGCTRKEHFKLSWLNNNLTIHRTTPDHCRRVPMKKWFVFDIPKQQTKFIVQNAFSKK